MIKTIIFDFDMTLVDSYKININVLEKLKKEFNINWEKLSKKDMWGIPYNEFINKISKTSLNKISLKKLSKMHLKYAKVGYKKTKLNSLKILQLLNKKGIRLAIISNNNLKLLKEVLKKYPNNKIKFDFVSTTQDKSLGKNKSEIIKKYLKFWKISKRECIYIGDHINDIKTAKKAGVVSASVTTGVYSKNELKKYHPDILISSLDELKNYII